MPVGTEPRKIVIVNQAVNYLTVDIANEFATRVDEVVLVTGSVHVQGAPLSNQVNCCRINKWVERPASKKLIAYVTGTLRIYFLLLFKYRKHEVLFISIPPMAYLLSVMLPQRTSVLIWDMYPDVFKITGMKETHPLYRVWAALNKRVFKKAFRLFTIGNKMADLVAQYVDRKKIAVTPIWSIFQENTKVPRDENPFVQTHALQDKFVVQYSGNIGLTHKVELMVEMAKQLKHHPEILFQIIGRGPRVPALQRVVKEEELNNCIFLPFQSDDMFPYSLSAADLGVVILDDLTAKGSVPSKSYNLMSFGIPALYIASPDSELHAYADQYQHGKCFSESDLSAAVDFILELSTDKKLQQHYSNNALTAAEHYKRNNATKLVDIYLSDREHGIR